MVKYETHKKIGFIFSIILIGSILFIYRKQLPIMGWKVLLIPLVIIFYSNIPDLDHHMSKLRKKTLTFIFGVMILSSIISYFIDIGLMLVLLMFTGFLGLGLLKVKHRGPLHTYWFVTIASLPLLLLNWFLFLIGIACSYSHIFVDRLFSKTKRKAKKLFGISGERKDYYFHFRL